MCVLGQRFEDLDEQVDRLLAVLPGSERTPGSVVMWGRPARHRGSGRGGVVDPDAAVVRVGLDERGIPVGLAEVV